MEHKRITVEEVLAAYETLGVKPMHHGYVDFWPETGRIDRCCPAFAVASVRDSDVRQMIQDLHDADPDAFEDCCAASLIYPRLGSSYAFGFTRAVDGMTQLIPDGTEYEMGKADGLAVRAALWPEPVAT